MADKKSKFKAKINLKDLLDAGCHFGHQAQRWNPLMDPYLYAVRDGVHIFDLAKTKSNLEKALDFVYETASNGGQIIFVGTKRQAQAIIKEEAKKAKMPFIAERWMGGLVTNWEHVKQSIKKLEDLKEKKKSGELASEYTKKENVLIDREIARLERFFGGLSGMKKLPAAIFVIDVKKEIAAVKEARMKNIAVIGVVDSNSNPTLIDWPIPANDDAVGSIKLIISLIADAAKEGQEVYNKKQVK